MSSSKDEKRRAVPKFASFRPKPAAAPEPVVVAPEPSTQAKEQSASASDSNHERTRHRHRHRHREREREHRRSPGTAPVHSIASTNHSRPRDEREREREPKPVAASSSAGSNDIFTFDKRGDPLILRYGTNDRSRVPSYRRFGAGKLMGSGSRFTIHHEGSSEAFSLRDSYRDGGSVFRDKNLMLARAGQTKPKRIRPLTGSSMPPASEDFVSLEEPPSKRRRKDQTLAEQQQHHHQTPDYRSIHGKRKPGQEESDDSSDDDDASSGSDDDSLQPEGGGDNDDMSTARKRSIELSRQVRDHPKDIASWLELISLQDALLRENINDDYQNQNPDAAKGIAGLKLSIYEEALSHTSTPYEREQVLEGLMREGSKVWDPKTLAKRWNEVTKTDGRGSFTLWKLRLNFELTQMAAASFTFEELRGFIAERLRFLSDALKTVSGEQEVASLCRQLVYVFLRLTRFLHDAGYSELAVAAWQATLEMTFSRPSSSGGEENVQTAMTSFADFWESEVPRIGEDGAKGWRDFVETGGMMSDPPEPKISSRPSDTVAADAVDPIKAWARAEQEEMRASCMPARTLDEGTEDDPFRIVMFSDIKDFLVWFPAAVVPCARLLLLDAFLTFCRLPTACLSSDLTFSALLRDPSVTGPGESFEVTIGEEEEADGGAGLSSAEVSRKAPDFRQQGGNMALSQDVLFSGPTWFQYLGRWSSTTQRQRSGSSSSRYETSWIIGTLRYLVRACGVEELAEYYLAIEWRHEPAGARKIAKALLKQYSSNMRLYNAYALIERANGNGQVSDKVLSSATGQKKASTARGNDMGDTEANYTSLSKSSSASSSTGNYQFLWSTWTWIHLESGQKQLALSLLCSSVESSIDNEANINKPECLTAISPVLLLKAKSHFSSARDYSLSCLQLENATQYAESLALLEYLAADEGSGTEPTSETQGNITAALSSIRSFSQELASNNQIKPSYHERLLQTAARLLYFHATHGPFRPIYLRSQLQTFIAAFPQNTLFLELFDWAESAVFRIDDHVRGILQQTCLTPAANHDCTATRRFAILHEARAGTVHSTRAAFEAALLDSHVCRGNVDMWLAYLRFSRRHRPIAAAKKRGKLSNAAAAAAKDVFYRAVAACPWSKRVYMEGFFADEGEGSGDSGGMMSSELRAVVDTMATKGLRVHVDLDEFVGRWKERQQQQQREGGARRR
ncbi:NRDE-2, necessary for RNA interference-domain-containing protein [Bombardia bombarda]|uniref:NRDE-2, necessary for RNA interference-domain-containing protein n=1 Tax=Bombardia bombarda TaxID=252184 RepID=A0AA39X9W5_9PEZI|nr:NRDE-2, necessary for RNA interference-domain-containing protein [Bombardia bombarda]